MNFDVNTLKSQLASGASPEDIAKALSDALNQAQKEYEAETQKTTKEKALAEARANLSSAFREYLILAVPDLSALCNEEDWKDLDKILTEYFEDMESLIAPLFTTKTSSKKTDDAITKFLKENNLF